MPNSASLTFDGANDYVTGASSQPSSIANLSAYTVEFWIYSITGTGFFGNAPEFIAHVGDWGTSHLAVNYTFGSVIQFYWTSGFSSPAVLTASTAGLSPLTWYHFAFTWDGTARKIIIGGVEVASTTTHSVAKPASTSSRPLLGMQSSGDGAAADNPFKGKLDEFRIWSVAKTATQVAAYKDTQADGSESNLLLCWRMNDGSGTVVDDISASNYNGSISGASWDTSIYPTLADAGGGGAAASSLILPPAYRHQHLIAR